MPIFIYNSLSRKKEPFAPQSPPKVNIYTCGVTVYDECHIGHARNLYIFDVIRRYLKYRGFNVKFVRNITDMDDKIINRARELKINWQQLVKKYIDRYYEDLKALGIEKADFEPRATENIKDMIKHIKSLVNKGYAYVTNTGVYFNVRKFKDYGKLSGQSIDSMLSGSREEPDETKADPLDFALWKISKPNEPYWVSPWEKGRPGWHIECSTMSMKYLKAETLDIHGGGRDLIFPHHENEIAQAEVITGKPFAKYWIHHGLLTINGQKMAKSSGNFVTIKDFIARYGDADILKLFFLSAHYSHTLDYSEQNIEDTKKALERIAILMDKSDRKVTPSTPLRAGKSPSLSGSQVSHPFDSAQGRQVTSKKFKEVEEIKNNFIESMDDDFNTPQGLASIFELVNTANKNIEDLRFFKNCQKTLRELLDIFGISLKINIKTKEEIETKEYIDVEKKIKEREKARKEKNYALADKVRKELEEKGIILEDTKQGTTWRRKL